MTEVLGDDRARDRSPVRRRHRRGSGRRAAALVAAALVAVATGDAVALRRLVAERPLAAEVAVRLDGFSSGGQPPEATYGFTIENLGGPLTVLGLEADVPGLAFEDSALSGPSLERPDGEAYPVVLPARAVAEVGLGYAVVDCERVPDDRSVRVRLLVEDADGRRGSVDLVPPGLPATRFDALPGAEDPWQRVMTEQACPTE